MRRGSIQNHNDKFLAIFFADLPHKTVHAVGIHLFAGHMVKGSITRTYRSILICELSDQGQINGRPVWRRGPTSPRIAHASKPGFVLKHQAHGQMVCVFYAGGRHDLGQFFLNSSCETGSLFGCFVSGCTLRHPWRANKRYVVDTGTSYPSRCTKAA